MAEFKKRKPMVFADTGRIALWSIAGLLTVSAGVVLYRWWAGLLPAMSDEEREADALAAGATRSER